MLISWSLFSSIPERCVLQRLELLLVLSQYQNKQPLVEWIIAPNIGNDQRGTFLQFRRMLFRSFVQWQYLEETVHN